MILKTKKPHRVVMKDGTVKMYQPGYEIKKEDDALMKQIQYHRLYRKDIYYSKLQESAQPEGEGSRKIPQPVKPAAQKPGFISKMMNAITSKPEEEKAPEVEQPENDEQKPAGE